MDPAALTERYLALTAAIQASRPEAVPRLIAVSKTHPAEAVAHLLGLGQREFGENRVQEAAGKFPALKAAWPDLRLHLIGPLQTNKAAEAVALFDVIHSVDRSRLVRILAEQMAKQGRRPDCLIQVNTGEEPQKAGCSPREMPDLLAEARSLDLPVVGLMCIPPVTEEAAPHFALLADLAAAHGLAVLSMGMSEDWPKAVRYGATHLRIGSALFGARSA